MNPQDPQSPDPNPQSPYSQSPEGTPPINLQTTEAPPPPEPQTPEPPTPQYIVEETSPTQDVTQPTEAPPATNVIPENPGSPKKMNLPAILLTILLILALGGAGFFAFQNFQLKQQISELESQSVPVYVPTELPSPTPTPDPTATWKTYQSPSVPFTFKYPDGPEWKLSDTSDSSGPAVAVTCEQCTTGNIDLFQVAQSPKYLSVNQYLEQDTLTTSKNQIMIGNIEAVRGVQSGSQQAGGSSLVTYVVYDNKGYLITQRFPNTLNKTLVSDFPNANPEILATFKFVATSPSASPTTSPTPKP